eukprot:gene148-37761_t
MADGMGRAHGPDVGHCRPGRDPRGWRTARFETTKGPFVVQLRPDLAPHGVQHLVQLIEAGYYDDHAVPFLR